MPLLVLTALLCHTTAASPPLALHPENPHYLLFRGRPTVLITSGEHYGAVLNLAFDTVPYLEELKACGLNLTRTFSGVYCEGPGSFKIKGNPLAPKPGRLLCPWARSTTPGYPNGGNKFDLTKWDEAYFARLKDFLTQAGQRGIVVELVLFCPFYGDAMWALSPMKASNNVNGIGAVPRTEVYTLKHPPLVALHESLVRKIATELNAFDNLYYEVCNEPYFGGVTVEWQHRIVEALVDAEKALPHQHLIAQNIANKTAKVEKPHPAVSIFNFHYATPPVAVGTNYGLGKVIADDETGFRGPSDFVYRHEGWEFLLGGGGIYSNLDYSFTPDHEDGTARPDAPGGGGRALRRQLQVLSQFLHGFDFVRMAPDAGVVKGGVPTGGAVHALVETGKQYALYVRGGQRADLVLDLPAGRYCAEWVNTETGAVEGPETFDHPGGPRPLRSPAYTEDIALRIKHQ
jgi:hypothetical protein